MEEYIEFIEQNLDKINWTNLSLNSAAIHILEANPDKINWTNLSLNPAAIHILEANPDKINWDNYYHIINPQYIYSKLILIK